MGGGGTRRTDGSKVRRAATRGRRAEARARPGSAGGRAAGRPEGQQRAARADRRQVRQRMRRRGGCVLELRVRGGSGRTITGVCRIAPPRFDRSDRDGRGKYSLFSMCQRGESRAWQGPTSGRKKGLRGRRGRSVGVLGRRVQGKVGGQLPAYAVLPHSLFLVFRCGEHWGTREAARRAARRRGEAARRRGGGAASRRGGEAARRGEARR